MAFQQNGDHPIVTMIETITPEKAQKYLEKNVSNRPIRERVLAALVRDIKSGEFKTTHQGIAFDEDGNLEDGQHRLTACVMADKPITVMVTRGVRRCDISVIDVGIKRSFADNLAFSGKYEDSAALRNKGTAAAVRKLVAFGYNSAIILTDHEMHVLLDALRPQIEALYHCTISRKSVTANLNAAALSALLCGEDEEDIYKFFSIYINGDSNGAEDYNISAAYNWCKQVVEAKVRRSPFAPTRLYSGTQNAIWNFIHAERSQFVRPTKNTRYPVANIIKRVLPISASDDGHAGT